MIFFAATGAGLPLAFLSSTACVASVYSLTKNFGSFQEALRAFHGNNANTNSSVIATLYGGTLIFSGNGAINTAELNKFAGRRDEIHTIYILRGVTSIPANAFSGYTGLRRVTIGNTPDFIIINVKKLYIPIYHCNSTVEF